MAAVTPEARLVTELMLVVRLAMEVDPVGVPIDMPGVMLMPPPAVTLIPAAAAAAAMPAEPKVFPTCTIYENYCDSNWKLNIRYCNITLPRVSVLRRI